MPPKTKKSDQNKDTDIVTKTLKDKYFELIKKENIGKTPEITKELDELEQAIRGK